MPSANMDNTDTKNPATHAPEASSDRSALVFVLWRPSHILRGQVTHVVARPRSAQKWCLTRPRHDSDGEALKDFGEGKLLKRIRYLEYLYLVFATSHSAPNIPRLFGPAFSLTQPPKKGLKKYHDGRWDTHNRKKPEGFLAGVCPTPDAQSFDMFCHREETSQIPEHRAPAYSPYQGELHVVEITTEDDPDSRILTVMQGAPTTSDAFCNGLRQAFENKCNVIGRETTEQLQARAAWTIDRNSRLLVPLPTRPRQSPALRLTVHDGAPRQTCGSAAIRQLLNDGAKAFFQGRAYAPLRSAYIDPQAVFDRLRLGQFTGRGWLREAVDSFLATERSGYFILNGYGGIGKTAFVADLARQRGYVHHFVEQGATQGEALSNLAVQLARAWLLEDRAAELRSVGKDVRPAFFYALLKDAAKRQRELRPDEKLVIVVDALNEAERPAAGNVLGLPEVLPDGVYFVVAQQPGGMPLTLGETHYQSVAVNADSAQNLDDVRRFLEAVASSPSKWPGITNAIQTGDCTRERFVQALTEKSQGLWLYLHHVVDEIERGQRSLAQLDDLPSGVWQYYAQFWQRWSASPKRAGVWEKQHLRLLGTLAAVQEPVAFSTLCALAKVPPTSKLRWLLEHPWRRFVIPLPGTDGTAVRYRLYHDVFRQFLEGRVEKHALFTADLQRDLVRKLGAVTREAHSRIANTFITRWSGNPTDLSAPFPGLRDPARRDIHAGYGLRYLSTHLRTSGRHDDLFALVATREWYDAHQAVDVSLDGYLKALAIAWEVAAAANAEKAARGESVPLLAKEIQYALITNDVKSCSSRVPAEVVLAFVESRRWTAAAGLNYALQHLSGNAQSAVIAGLVRDLPSELQRMAFQYALTAWGTNECAVIATMAVRMAYQLPEGELKAVRSMLTTACANAQRMHVAGELATLAHIRPITGNDGLVEEAQRIMLLIDEKALRTSYLRCIVECLAEAGDTKTAERIIGLIPDSRQQRAEKKSLAQHVEAHARRSASCDVDSELNTLDDVETWFAWPASRFYNCDQELRSKVLRRAYDVVMRQPSDIWPGWAFETLACCLATANMSEEAAKVINAQKYQSCRHARALCRLASCIGPEKRDLILNAVWTDLTSIQDQEPARMFIVRLVRHLGSVGKQAAALRCLQTLSFRPMRGAILIETLPLLELPLGSELQADAMGHTCGLLDQLARVRALSIVILHLQGTLKAEAEHEAIQSLDRMEPPDRAVALLWLCGRCANPSVRGSPRQLVAELRDIRIRATGTDWQLRDLALDLIERGDTETAELVVDCIGDDTELLKATCALLPCLLPTRANARANATLRLAWSERNTVSSISTEVLGVVRYMGAEERGVVVDEVLGLARRSDDSNERARLFAALYPCLRDDTEREAVMSEALNAAYEVKDVGAKCVALARLACCSPLGQRQALMKDSLSMMLRAIDAEQFFLLPPALDELMAIVSESAPSDLYPVVNRVLHSGSHPPRHPLFTMLTALVPILVKVAGAETAVDICAAVNACLTVRRERASPADTAVSFGPPSAAPTATSPRSSGRRLCAGSGGGSTVPIMRANSSSNEPEALQ